MDTKQTLAVIEGLSLLVAGVTAYTGNEIITAAGIGLAGLLRLFDEFV